VLGALAYWHEHLQQHWHSNSGTAAAAAAGLAALAKQLQQLRVVVVCDHSQRAWERRPGRGVIILISRPRRGAPSAPALGVRAAPSAADATALAIVEAARSSRASGSG
jgi:hypothetical protein